MPTRPAQDVVATNIHSMIRGAQRKIKDVSNAISLATSENIAGQNKRERYLIKRRKLDLKNISK